VHRAFVARYAIVNPDMKIVGIEKKPVMLAGSRALHPRVLVNIDTLSGHKHLHYFDCLTDTLKRNRVSTSKPN
jgi:hypothetical protein